ncbi:hypothetical protein LTR37_006437 [Vermiconidia calcicola]|uniref:Uncharacterized protein n=1 Tax=Vermiconidia calcicola TaxID=1690605 RepID=A0ACC3NHM8_9PEZI|nr:hypothetical protein LTR37_006437 [Vermiconidia calcicola]
MSARRLIEQINEEKWLHPLNPEWFLLFLAYQTSLPPRHLLTQKSGGDFIYKLENAAKPTSTFLHKAAQKKSMMKTHEMPIGEAMYRKLYIDPEARSK